MFPHSIPSIIHPCSGHSVAGFHVRNILHQGHKYYHYLPPSWVQISCERGNEERGGEKKQPKQLPPQAQNTAAHVGAGLRRGLGGEEPLLQKTFLRQLGERFNVRFGFVSKNTWTTKLPIWKYWNMKKYHKYVSQSVNGRFLWWAGWLLLHFQQGPLMETVLTFLLSTESLQV